MLTGSAESCILITDDNEESKFNESARTMKKIISLDLDNTVSDFSGGMRRHIAAKSGLSVESSWEIMPEPNTYSMDNWDWSRTVFNGFLDAFDSAERHGIYGNMEFIDHNALNAVQRIRNLGHEVHAVTARPQKWNAETKASMKRWGLKVDKLVHVDAKHKYGADIYIDDAEYQLERFHQHGIAGIVFTNRYNEHLKNVAGRVNSWAHADRVVARVVREFNQRGYRPRSQAEGYKVALEAGGSQRAQYGKTV